MKPELRATLAARRAEAAEADPDAGVRLAAMFPDDLVPKTGALVSGYVRFRSEIDPAPLMKTLAAKGCRLALPRVAPGARLSFHLWSPDEPLVRSAFGLLEPAADAPVVDPDLLLVPLLGFDSACRRIGYGRGHYDRTLARLRAAKAVRAVGVAFAGQEVAAIPVEPHDEPLDAVVTPASVFRRP